MKFCLALLSSCTRHLSALELFDVQTFKKKSDRKKILIEFPVTDQSLITENNAYFPFIITTIQKQVLCLQSMLFGDLCKL